MKDRNINSIFKQEIILKLKTLRAEMNILAHENVSYSGFAGVLGGIAISSSVNVLAGIFGILAALGLISAVLSGGLAAAVAVLGLIAGVGFSVYYHNKKNKQHKRAANFFEREGSDVDIEEIAELLAMKNQSLLLSFTEEEAKKLASEIYKKISNEILKNDLFSLKSLYQTSVNVELVKKCRNNALVSPTRDSLPKIIEFKLPHGASNLGLFKHDHKNHISDQMSETPTDEPASAFSPK